MSPSALFYQNIASNEEIGGDYRTLFLDVVDFALSMSVHCIEAMPSAHVIVHDLFLAYLSSERLHCTVATKRTDSLFDCLDVCIISTGSDEWPPPAFVSFAAASVNTHATR